MTYPRPSTLYPWLLALTIAALAAACGAGAKPGSANLLAGLQPTRVVDVTNVGALTDGIAAVEGGAWDSSLAAIFRTSGSFVELDLGEVIDVRAAFLQGDNNDRYRVSLSEDGLSFVPLWVTDTRGNPGLQDRSSGALNGRGRWVRLGVENGDAACSVSEVQLFAQRPARLPPPMQRLVGESLGVAVRTALLYLVAAFGIFIFATSKRAKPWALPLAALVPLTAAGFVVSAGSLAWPMGAGEVSCVRAVAAAIALLAALRGAVFRDRWPCHPFATRFAWVTGAGMALAAFYNLGHPQFFNHAHNRPEFVHTYDMRVYQPFARFFDELGYDGVYDASVLAYAEDHLGGSLESIKHVRLRSLRDHEVRTVGDYAPEILAIRGRFTPARWDDLRHDMAYFETVMGPEFLGTLTDHGANATPVWVFFARILLGHEPATETSLSAAGLVDAGLLLVLTGCLWRAFGLIPMLLAMTAFGATDIYMFGTNWAGATLRHDWLVLLGLGACALKLHHWRAAGLALALAALIRAFPAVALAGVAIPLLWDVVERARKYGVRATLASWRELREQHAGTVRVLSSAAVCMVASFLVTGFLYSFGAWRAWWQKVSLLNAEDSVNEVSLRALVAGSGDPASALHARHGLLIVAQVLVVVCIVALARRRPPHQAMLIALPLIWAFSNPSSYYSHVYFLFALLATSEEEAAGPAQLATMEVRGIGNAVPLFVPLLKIAVPLLGMCIAGYWLGLDGEEERHFTETTALLFVMLGGLYGVLLRSTFGRDAPVTRLS